MIGVVFTMAEAIARTKSIWPLRGRVQKYAWGKIGEASAVAQLYHSETQTPIKSDDPYAGARGLIQFPITEAPPQYTKKAHADPFPINRYQTSNYNYNKNFTEFVNRISRFLFT